MGSRPDLLSIIQSIFSHSPSPQRTNHAPNKTYTGLTPLPPISTFLRFDTGTLVIILEYKEVGEYFSLVMYQRGAMIEKGCLIFQKGIHR